jgi:hypothetical protein
MAHYAQRGKRSFLLAKQHGLHFTPFNQALAKAKELLRQIDWE